MKPKIVFLDVDGTLVSVGSSVPSKKTIGAIRRAQSNGHKVCINSGRNVKMLEELIPYRFDSVISSTGGLITVGDEVILDRPMSDEMFKSVLALFHRNDIFCIAETRDSIYYDSDSVLLARYAENNIQTVKTLKKTMVDIFGAEPLSVYNGSPVYQILFVCQTEAQMDAVRAALEAEFEFMDIETGAESKMNLCEIVPRDHNKGMAVKAVCDYFNISTDDAIAFGDSMNDIDMFKTVAVSVCMENGCQELKSVSDVVCPSSDNNGIAVAFERLGLI